MSAAALALVAAAVYGAGDFFGGLAARRAPLVLAVALSQAVGFVLLLLLATTVAAPAVEAADLWWGGGAGIATVIGITLLYGALAVGRMSVVAPITAVCAIVLPVLAGFLLGERLAAAALAGIVLAILAVILIGQEATPETEGREATQGRERTALLMALGAGAAIAGFYLAMERTAATAGLWPLVMARVVSVAVLAAATFAMVRPADRMPSRGALAVAFASGAFDSTANALFLLAVREGSLGIVATLTSLYPASTVLLAWLVLRERIRPVQAAGLAVATAAVILITAG